MHINFLLLICFLIYVDGLKLPSSTQNFLSTTNTQKFSNKGINNLKSYEIVTKYFEYWNQRDFNSAADLFSVDCTYEDTVYPETFNSRNEVKFHLERVANALPDNFQFKIDEITTGSGSTTVGVKWHVEAVDVNTNEITLLPFTRGASMYTVENGEITSGFDVVEPSVKSGNLTLGVLEVASSVITDPKRGLIWAAWAAYCYFLFLSNVLPGPNALALDTNTWNEVLSLSKNFWFVLPILDNANADVLHPGLEGIFNMVLCWAGIFVGFALDGRQTNNNDNESGSRGRLSIASTLLAMQALTNAVFLPYLARREAENSATLDSLPQHELNQLEKIGESRWFPTLIGSVFTLCIYWFILGRPEFGDLQERNASLLTFIGHDRLGTSFVIDLIYFWVFQGVLVDDDVNRRITMFKYESNNSDISDISDEELKKLVAPYADVGKFFPFYGLVLHMLTRKQIN